MTAKLDEFVEERFNEWSKEFVSALHLGPILVTTANHCEASPEDAHDTVLFLALFYGMYADERSAYFVWREKEIPEELLAKLSPLEAIQQWRRESGQNLLEYARHSKILADSKKGPRREEILEHLDFLYGCLSPQEQKGLEGEPKKADPDKTNPDKTNPEEES